MKLENFKYKFLTAIRYLGDGFFYPFFAIYLKSTGLGESKVGLLLAISPLLGIILNPIYTRICKNVNITKLVLGIISILEGFVIVGISISSQYYLLLVLTIILAIFGSCHYALMDSLLATYSHVHHINYSGIRLFGSAAYIAATFGSGLIADLSGYTMAFIISGLLFVIAGISYLMLKNIEYREDDHSDIKIPIKDLFKNNRYVLYLIFYGILHAAFFSSSNYLSTYLEFRGVSSRDYGLAYSYFVGVEVLTLIVLNRVKKHYNVWLMMIVSAFTLAIRTFVYYLNLPVIVVILISGLRGLGFGFVLHTSYSYVIHLVGEKAGQRGIMLTQLWYALCLTGFNYLNGYLIDYVSYEIYHLVMTFVGIVLIIYALSMFIYTKKNKYIKKYIEQIEN